MPADLPPEVLLPDAAFDPITGDRVETDGVSAWALPDSCAIDPPAAAAMRGVTVGTGEFEAPVGLQQVAVFADADTAVAEADRLVAALTSCSPAADDTQTRYLPEPVAVGAQGTGLATDYYGAAESGSEDAALGSYLAVTRRGAAITLVANDGGESTIGVARSEVTDRLQAAWELLCRYDSAGC